MVHRNALEIQKPGGTGTDLPVLNSAYYQVDFAAISKFKGVDNSALTSMGLSGNFIDGAEFSERGRPSQEAAPDADHPANTPNTDLGPSQDQNEIRVRPAPTQIQKA
ncbi:MAG: hypothetical protein C0507_11060 [Cyanobacteria bacterium PR.3.49]|jgi:hypothetical protein|nr:hypothetical protein [Cyanobacteria bacterium PR.3.49]